MGMRDEILEQPTVAARLLETGLSVIEEIARAIQAREIEFVLIAGRGTSDHAGVYAQYIFGTRNDLPVALAAPSLVSIYGARPRLRRALVIGISQSGRSPDVVGVVEEGRRQGALTLAVTNDRSSPLAVAAEWVIDVAAGPERAVAATKTYTAELLVLALLSTVLRDGAAGAHETLARVPAAMRSALDAEADAERAAAHFRDMRACVVLGRGFEYATALEWALKLKELTYLFADAYSAADFQHGPIAMAEPGLPVLAVAPSGRARADMLSLLARLHDELGATLLVVADRFDGLPAGADVLGLSTGSRSVDRRDDAIAILPDWLMPIVSIIPGQLFAYHLALARGGDPEKPRSISKITLTR
jgi:glucosamine--fructose-6-phosphate aminotransferase (isomerizing)